MVPWLMKDEICVSSYSFITELPFPPPEKAGGTSDDSTPTDPASKWPSVWDQNLRRTVKWGEYAPDQRKKCVKKISCIRSVCVVQMTWTWIRTTDRSFVFKTRYFPMTKRLSSLEKECVLKVLLQDVFFVSIQQKHCNIPQLSRVCTI